MNDEKSPVIGNTYISRITGSKITPLVVNNDVYICRKAQFYSNSETGNKEMISNIIKIRIRDFFESIQSGELDRSDETMSEAEFAKAILSI